MAVHTPTGAASPTAHDFGPDGDRAPARSVLEIVRDVAGVGPNDIAPEWRLLWSSAAAAMAVGASGGLGQLTPPPNQQSRDLLPATVSPNVQRLSVPRPVLPPPPSVEPARPSVLPDVIRRNVLQEARSLSANQVDERRAPLVRRPGTQHRIHAKPLVDLTVVAEEARGALRRADGEEHARRLDGAWQASRLPPRDGEQCDGLVAPDVLVGALDRRDAVVHRGGGDLPHCGRAPAG